MFSKILLALLNNKVISTEEPTLTEFALAIQPKPSDLSYSGNYRKMEWCTTADGNIYLGMAVGTYDEAWENTLSIFKWYELIEGVLVPQTPLLEVPDWNNVKEFKWHTHGENTYLFMFDDSEVLADACRWYKLVDSVLIRQPQPVYVPPGGFSLIDWITHGEDTYLATIGWSETYTSIFVWYKLVDGVLVLQSTPTELPTWEYFNRLDWHNDGTDTYLTMLGENPTEFKWYKLVDGTLVVQTIPTDISEETIYDFEWYTVANNTYLVISFGTETYEILKWYKLVDGTLVIQTDPTGPPIEYIDGFSWQKYSEHTYLCVPTLYDSSESCFFRWYKLVDAVLLYQSELQFDATISIQNIGWGASNTNNYAVIVGTENLPNGDMQDYFNWFKVIPNS